MPSLPGARARVAAAAVLLISTGIGVGLSNAPGAGAATSVKVEQPAGTLRLHLSNSGSSITYTGPLVGVPASQPITVNGCALSTGGALLTMTPNPNKFGMGLIQNGLGVRGKNNCATDNGQISGSESITLGLGSAFGPDVRVTVAELDIEGKHSADLGVAFDGGATSSEPLNNSSDNGPDSGVGDNDRVVLDENFQAVKLSAAGGEVALEGGGDGTYAQYLAEGIVGPEGMKLGTADTIFKLVTFKEYEEALGCNDTITETLIGGAADSATVTRGQNIGGGPCEDVGATLEITDAGVLVDKATTGLVTGAAQAVNAEIDIKWEPQPAQLPLDPREIDFDGAGAAFEFEDVKWCLGKSNGTFIHPPDSRFPAGVLPWCLVEDNVKLLDGGMLSQVQKYHGAGDPLWR